ncbi:AAA family ATPase [Streptomyces physcomitrii]|uniref:helix-turn-helix transcriptional regulator n=1 Tax=Streptomyces physcomitrii TaxID=2724184 RepID=UPI00340EAA35
MTLYDRDKEFTRVEKALDSTFSGTAGIVLLEGAVGCGRTEFLKECADLAQERGARVLYGGGAEGETLPHGLLRRLLAPLAPRDGQQRSIPTHQEFAETLAEAAEDAPVVLCVDDFPHADGPSLGYLLHLARVVRRQRILLILTGPLHERTDSPVLGTELLRHPGFVRIPLTHLSPAGTAALLTEHAGAPVAAPPAERLHALSGGNPLLLRALLAEQPLPQRESDEWPAPEAGGPFTKALLTCLHRSGSGVRELARAVAVLGEHATPELAARLAGTTPSRARQGLTALESAGLTRDCRLSHPAVAAAVLDDLPAAERTALHGRAAHILDEAGVRAASVARHLLAAGTAEGPRAVRVLHEAARQSLVTGDDSRHAVACLELARSGCADESTDWDLDLRLAAVTWRFDPAAAEGHLKGPLAALRAARLGAAAAGHLARLLVTQGRIEEAAEALEYLARATGSGGGAQCTREDPLRGLFALPPAEDKPAPAPAAGEGGAEQPAEPVRTVSAELRSSASLWTHPGTQADEQAIDKLLEGTPLAQSTFDPMVQAVRTLVHTDHADRAVTWCRTLRPEGSAAPGWNAVFGYLQAEAQLRLGDLAGAEQQAEAAMEAVADRGGLFQFGPLATLVLAQTARGSYDAVARQLQTSVPEELFTSVYSLNFLRARGHYYLATHRHKAALGEFLDAGRLARRWGLDRPQQLPWRTDAAEALLALGEHRQAERFVLEQLATPDARGPRLRGVTLRLRAATTPLRQRPKLLTRAVDELRRSGDRFELARALADLGRSLQMMGEGTRAAMVTRRAWHLAAQCGAVPLAEQILPGQGGQDRKPNTPEKEPVEAGASDTDQLSESEKRVVSLAAYGYTNREISAKLYITVSTVEQHLTRVYRKLNITRRQELPMDLHFETLEHAG